MLLFHRPTADQVGTIDLNRQLLSILLLSILPLATLAKEKAKEKRESPSLSASPGEQSLSNIPLVVGHEAKGLVLPDFVPLGHLRASIEAGTAASIDDDEV